MIYEGSGLPWTQPSKELELKHLRIPFRRCGGACARAIREFWAYYRQQGPLDDNDLVRLENHLLNIETISQILAPVRQIDDRNPDAWTVMEKVKGGLLAFFKEVQVYGPPSPGVISRVRDVSRRCISDINRLNDFSSTAEARR